MSTQVIAGAAAGAAVIGGGGTLAAYAAGAFGTGWESETFEEYAKSLNLKYVGETGTTSPGALPDKAKVKSKIENSTNGAEYRKVLDDHWDAMESNDVKEKDRPTRTGKQGNSVFPSGTNDRTKDEEIAGWVVSWCSAAKDMRANIKKVKGANKEWNTDLLNKNAKWQAFKAVCFEKTT
ncbi:hypothetical protein [Candidatus Mycoplasma haematohominis]|uniref:Uncharacterized protein n=1 Tax=Candidatus Mycoplasma haematohominis TaxID=1494318 RepID=A0A478FUD0_9MOLU|nr:hypothetical protein [Candidatus Mycoplasma haemohominis]GCE64049.1 hypothetical protein MHSWG343_10570 [Candidatus Mycoplasma haemohominis]